MIAPHSIIQDSPPRRAAFYGSDAPPKELRRRPQWVVHREKIPYDPKTGKRAKSTDLMTWGTFFEALEAYETGRYDGIGFVFCSADPYTGIDLDKCRDPQSEKIDPQVLEIINAFPGAYTEVSPSGTGVHIIIRGKLDADRNRHGNIEVYSQERYFTVSGVAL